MLRSPDAGLKGQRYKSSCKPAHRKAAAKIVANGGRYKGKFQNKNVGATK